MQQFTSSGKRHRLKRLWFGKKTDQQEHAEFVAKMKSDLFIIPAAPTGGRL